MQVFEFHFNPPSTGSGQAKDLVFDSFCYEPENIYEKRVGSLYMLGLLKNVLPQNVRFLERLAKIIKEKYYSSTLIKPEKSLKNSLKEANEFLENISRRGDVSWLGNLSFGAIAIKNFELNFTKVGDLKFFLIRKGQVVDIDQRLKLEEIEPYPLKIFGNIVSGKLAENDVILALTEEALDTFRSQNLIQEIAKTAPLDEKKIKEMLNRKHDVLSKISGVCLLISLVDEYHPPAAKEVISSKPKEFSLKEIFIPALNCLLRLKSKIKKPELKKPQIKKPKIKIPKLSLPSFPSLPRIPRLHIPRAKPQLEKKLVLVFALLICLALGSLIAQSEERQRIEKYRETLIEIKEKIDKAESLLILKGIKTEAAREANALLKDGWNEIAPLSKISSTLPQDLSNEISALKKIVTENLYQLNQLVIVEEPELFFEFNQRGFVPQKMVASHNALYFFNTFAENLFLLTKDGAGQVIQINKKFNGAATLSDSVVFFEKPDQLTVLKDGQLNFSSLQLLTDFNYDYFSSYKSNLYIFDRKRGEIIKYPYWEEFQWSSPQFWLAPKTKKAINAKSMAVDGSIWFLNSDNSVTKYSGGWPKDTLTIELFPSPKNFSKIVTAATLPYLYLLEPDQSRIVILDKSGRIFKQFQSKSFDNLLDFAVSEDGNTIYLLCGLKVFTLTLL